MSTKVVVTKLPACDVCKHVEKVALPKPALVDGKMKYTTSWAYMCAKHWASHGVGRLGLGYGQRLVIEVPMGA